ncbi:STAS domain-containing protein [Spongiibacter marinus]|uniref:STAS domain-containing protein n=1 Tax=Spongiibacter marinus TaxID=354246 RepID=UPI00040E53D2|nr:STAS domain-containing protein [Spongiibacter marinus]
MADEEFIILLGDEPEEGSGADVNGPEQGSAASNAEDDGFVVLLTSEQSEVGGRSLPSELVIASAGSLYQVLAEFAADTDGDISIDASTVEQVDSAGLQLLALFRQSQQKTGREVSYQGFPDEIDAVIRRAGFASLLAA